MPFKKGNTIRPKSNQKKGRVPKGQKEFESRLTDTKHLSKRAILAKCYDCMGFYVDGTLDCECPDCPLYPWMPYKEK